MAIALVKYKLRWFHAFINFKNMNYLKPLSALLGLIVFASCSSSKLVTTAVAYQSVRTEQYKPEIPDDAKIVVGYSISSGGSITAVVRNLTNEIMIIDQTKSFFVDTDGRSISYYDPTVRTTSNTTMASSSTGASVNLGAIAGAIGIGGAIGRVLGGVNVGGSNTAGASTTNTTYFADQPHISLAPKSHGAMSKVFPISGIGEPSLQNASETYASFTSDNSIRKFSVCISYSIDGGETFEKIVTPFYLNSIMICPVKQHGIVNEALRTILSKKPDAIYEPWWLLYSCSNLSINDNICQGILTDYQ